jgi:hypothetical protein
MSLLDRLFPVKDPRPKVHEDKAFGLPGGRAAQDHAARGDWRRLREIMAAERDAARRWRYANIAAEGLEARVRQWLEGEPGDPDAWLVAGIDAINRGGAIRGSAKADDTPEDRWDPFEASIHEAEKALSRAVELRPDDPLPRLGLLNTAVVLGRPLEERVARFEEVLSRAPSLVSAHVGIMTALTKKWGGSHEQMFETARRSVAAAPAGSAVPAVLPLAHVERWLYVVHWENDEERSRRYFRAPEVLREIRDCHRRCARVEQGSAPWAANVFAFCFHLADDARAARQEFEKAAGLYTGLPWDYLGGIKAYDHAMGSIWRRGALPAGTRSS